MPASCPDCGAPVEYVSEPARLLTGTCGTCHHEFTIVGGHLDVKTGTRGPSHDGAGEPREEEAPSAPSGPTCPDCGAPTELRVTSSRSIESICADCNSTRTFVLSDGRRPPSREQSRPDRGWPDRGERRAPSTSRPCRQCGAPLTFTTGEDGLLTGECTQCGNRFTLPARRDSGGPRNDRRERPSYGRGRPSGYSGGRNFARGSGRSPSYERRGRRNDSSDDGDAPRRRRPRRE
jgi:hypothetical protein